MAKDKKSDVEKDIDTLDELKEKYSVANCGEKNSDICKKVNSLLSAAKLHIGNIKPQTKKDK